MYINNTLLTCLHLFINIQIKSLSLSENEETYTVISSTRWTVIRNTLSSSFQVGPTWKLQSPKVQNGKGVKWLGLDKASYISVFSFNHSEASGKIYEDFPGVQHFYISMTCPGQKYTSIEKTHLVLFYKWVRL